MWRAGEDVRLRDLDLVVPTSPVVPAADRGEALGAMPEGPAVFEIGDCNVPRTAFARRCRKWRRSDIASERHGRGMNT